MGKDSIEAQHGAGTGDADDHLAFIQTAGGQLEIAAANQIQAPCIIALLEQGGLSRQRDGAGGQLQIGQNRAAQRTKPAGAAIGACRAACRDLP